MSELVGDAYVRLTVDSSGIRGAVKREGEKTGDEFAEGFDRRMEKAGDDSIERLMDRLARGFTDLDFGDFERKLGGVDEAVSGITDAMDDLSRQGKLTIGTMEGLVDDLEKWERLRKEALSAEDRIAEERRLLRVYEATAKARFQWERELGTSQSAAFREEERRNQRRFDRIQELGRAQIEAFRYMDQEEARLQQKRDSVYRTTVRARAAYEQEQVTNARKEQDRIQVDRGRGRQGHREAPAHL